MKKSSSGLVFSKPDLSCVQIDNGLVISDLWAWGWEPPAALVAFSASLIVDHELVDFRHWRFAPADQLAAGAHLEDGMISWWEDRVAEKHYLAKLVAGGPRAKVSDAGKILNSFMDLLPLGSGIYFGNASQDAPLLRSAINRSGVVVGWSISDQMCLNTMRRYDHG